MGHQRLHAGPGGGDPALRLAVRSLRRQTRLSGVAGAVHPRVCAVWAGDERRDAHRHAHPARPRRRHAHANRHGRALPAHPARAPRRHFRHVRPAGDGRPGPRPAAVRLSPAVRRLATDLPDQPAGRGAGPVGRRAGAAGDSARPRGGSARYPRHPARPACVRRDLVRGQPVDHRRMDRPDDTRWHRDRTGCPGAVRLARAGHRRSGARAACVSGTRLHPWHSDPVGRDGRDVRDVLPDPAVSAAGAGLRCL